MPAVAIVVGVVLLAVGLAGYAASGAVTALIPAGLGLLLGVLGGLAWRPHLRKHAMHAAVGVALLGALASVGGLVRLLGALAGADPGPPLRTGAEAVTAIACGLFVALGVRSFVLARRRR